MVSHYHYLRNSKRSQSGEAIKSLGRKTYGYDFGNDGWRPIVNYNQVKKWVDSKVGKPWDDVWSDAHRRWNNDTYIGKEAIEYVYHLIQESRWSDYYVENGILKKHPKRVYRFQKRKSKFVKYEGKTYFRHDNIWYEVETKKPQINKHGQFYFVDEFLGLVSGYKYYTENYLNKFYGAYNTVFSKKQVGKRVCKKLNQIVAQGV